MQKNAFLLLFSTAFAASLFSPSSIAEANIQQGEKLFQRNCALCHGKQGEKSALNQSAIINQLKVDEISTALQERKSGKIIGAGNMAKSRLSEQDMQDIATYLQSLSQ